jgi:DNA replication protein DnaC
MEYIQCRKCRKPIPKNKPPLPKGFYYEEVERTGTKYWVAKECECHRKWERENKIEKSFLKKGFDSSFAKWELENNYFDNDTQKYITKINNYLTRINDDVVRNSIIYLCGNSTQKTALANYMGRKIIGEGYSCNKISYDALILLLHHANADEEEAERVEQLKDCDVLFIDNFMNKAQSLWGGYILSFLIERISNGKGIVFVSSTKPNYLVNLHTEFKEIQILIMGEIDKKNSLFFIEDNPNCNGPDLRGLFD